MTKPFILFDLDGTITDPAIGITNSVMYSLEKYGIHVKEREELYRFIGPPLWESYERYYGFSKEEAEQAVGYYREYYKKKGIFENYIYDGMEDMLRHLKHSGKTLAVATSKPTVFAKQIIDHFKLDGYFDFIAGSEMDGTRVKKNEVIAYALENCMVTELSQAVMVGDREHDVIGAKKVGVSSIGVLYGYGNLEELQGAGSDFIVKDVEGLRKLL